MIIIDQWYKSHIESMDKGIEIKESSDNKYEVVIDGKTMAKVDDKNIAEILVQRLNHFIAHYRRKIDTFDIYREIEIIKQNPNSGFGSYYS